MGRQVGIRTVHIAAISRYIRRRADFMGVGKMQFKGHGMDERSAMLPQHHAHFKALGRGLPIHVQQYPDEGLLLRLGKRFLCNDEEVDIPRFPSKATHGQGTVQIDPRELIAQDLPVCSHNTGKKIPFLHDAHSFPYRSTNLSVPVMISSALKRPESSSTLMGLFTMYSR